MMDNVQKKDLNYDERVVWKVDKRDAVPWNENENAA